MSAFISLAHELYFLHFLSISNICESKKKKIQISVYPTSQGEIETKSGKMDNLYNNLVQGACVHKISIKILFCIFITYLDHNYLFVQINKQILLQIILQQNQRFSFPKQLYLNF